MKLAPIWKTATWGCLIGVVLLAGCAATPPAAFYTLAPLPPANMPLSARGPGPGISVGVGPVTFPDVLDRPQIVTRPSPNRVDVSEFHRWGGSLKQTLPRILAEDIGTCLGSGQVMVAPARERNRPAYRVAVDILRFDGRLGDAVDLVAVWKVTPQKGESPPAANRSEIRTPVAGDGYEAFVAAQSRAVAALAEAIAQAITDLAAADSPQGD